MSYTKTNWQTGDIVTAEKLNNLENGVESAQLPTVSSIDNGKVLTVANGAWGVGNGQIYFVTQTETGIAESYNELKALVSNNIPVFITMYNDELEGSEAYVIYSLSSLEKHNEIYFASFAGAFEYDASDPNDPMAKTS